MKCKNCQRKYAEHGSKELGCPIYDTYGRLLSFSHTIFYEKDSLEVRKI